MLRTAATLSLQRALVLLRSLAPVFPLLLAGCSDVERPVEEITDVSAPPESGGTAVLAEQSDMSLPMPLLIQTVLDGDLQDIMFMSLYKTAWEDGRAIVRTADESPVALARRYEYLGADSTQIRFYMRSDASWSDGQRITAHDVTWTYEAMGDPGLPSPRREYLEQMDSVVADNDSTVTFHFSRHYPEMLFHAGHGIVPRHVYAGASLDQLHSHPSVVAPAENMVVSGPFRIDSWERGQRIVFVRNSHFLPRPYLDRIVIRIIPDETTRLVELRTGKIDAMRVASPANLPSLRQQSPEIRLERIARRFSEFVAYNARHETFGDAEIRRALGLAIDVPTIIEALELTGYADPAASFYSPIFADLHDPDLRPLGYDPARARQILDAKGWRDDDGDGIREKNGERFTFTLLSNAGNQRRSDLATVLQDYWRRIGVDARPQQQEFQTMAARLVEKQFEAVIYGWQVPLSADISGQWAPDAMFNFVSYRNPELQRLMQTALAQRTESEAAPYWKAAARLVAQDQPYTWLYYMDQVVALRSRLRGADIDTYGLYQNVWEWWIPRSQQGTDGGRPPASSAPHERSEPPAALGPG